MVDAAERERNARHGRRAPGRDVVREAQQRRAGRALCAARRNAAPVFVLAAWRTPRAAFNAPELLVQRPHVDRTALRGGSMGERDRGALDRCHAEAEPVERRSSAVVGVATVAVGDQVSKPRSGRTRPSGTTGSTPGAGTGAAGPGSRGPHVLVVVVMAVRVVVRHRPAPALRRTAAGRRRNGSAQIAQPSASLEAS